MLEKLIEARDHLELVQLHGSMSMLHLCAAVAEINDIINILSKGEENAENN